MSTNIDEKLAVLRAQAEALNAQVEKLLKQAFRWYRRAATKTKMLNEACALDNKLANVRAFIRAYETEKRRRTSPVAAIGGVLMPQGPSLGVAMASQAMESAKQYGINESFVRAGRDCLEREENMRKWEASLSAANEKGE